ncbi:MAG: phosphoenolpyruvate synthase [Candidatus Hydrothermarchaeota archaeon]|nr:MAG: phosphoenolpyruvate synthase [Candidatus Hydrothermarchaeota archaeon]
MEIVWFNDLSKEDVGLAGGKGANLGELVRAGLPVPEGFVVTSKAYKRFLKDSGLWDKISKILENTDVDKTRELQEASKKIRELIINTPMPEDLKVGIREYYQRLADGEEFVAIRSSATAEDLPGASFAGQQETYLNIKGAESVVEHVQKCWSSLFTPRAIFYREKKGFKHEKVAIAVVVQRMINADKAGVMFTIHPATGEKDKIVIEAAWGLGEGVVSGSVTPDHYVVDKNTGEIVNKEIALKEIMFVRDKKTGKTVKKEVPESKKNKRVLNEKEIKELANFGKIIEDHYEFPQDIEWAIEGKDIYILQSRPITVLYKEEKEVEKEEGEREILVKGLGASPGIGSGKVKIISSAEELDKIKEGDVLVTVMTNPDMVPAMKRASAIVTDEGGMTCHAAIVSRELGIPCIVGTQNATKVLKDNMEVTVDGTRGIVYKGLTKVEKKEEVVVAPAPKIVTATEIKANISIPEIAPRVAHMADGVGLLRVEHMILGVGKHPIKFIRDGEEEELINRIAEGVRKVAQAFYPKPVWYRTLDAPTDEFRALEGGEDEPIEHNPMLGWRGIRRGLDQPELLKAEFKAIKKLVEEGFRNIGVMLPLVQHPEEVRKAKEIAKEVGLIPHKDVKFGIMIETPAAALIVEDFIKEGIDFVSFGTNDLTQYTLALDRNNERVAKLYTEKHKAVQKLIKEVILTCRKYGVETSICGQAGSDPEIAEKLVEYGITSISANPDAVEVVREMVARTELRLLLDRARE